jgi:hypothetical protein
MRPMIWNIYFTNSKVMYYVMGVEIMKVTFLNCKRRSFEYLVMLVIMRHVDKYLKIIIF